MREPSDIVDGTGKVLTLEDLIAAIDRHEKTSSNVPKVDTLHFSGEWVSDWLDLVEHAMVGLSDEVKFQQILKYVLHGHHQEVGKVVEAANGIWARFRDDMQRTYQLGDGLLTTADLEAMNKDDFSMIGAFMQEFKKRARKVHGISEKAQCAIFLGLLTASEASELTSHGGGSAKLTWATIDKGVEDGSLDQCNHCNSCGGGQAPPGQMVPYSDPSASAGPPSFLATQGQFTAQPPTSQQASQASVAGGGGQGQGGQGNGGRGQGGRGGGGRGRNNGGRGGGWNGQGSQNQGGQGGQKGGQGYERPRFDWRNVVCRHCGIVGHTIRFCQQRRDDELADLIFTNMDGDIYDKFGQYIDPKIPGGVRQEAQRRAAAGPAPPTMFILWQEREDPRVRIEEVIGETEEVTQRLKAGTIKKEPIVIESDDKDSREVEESFITILEKMEDLLEKVGRYQQRLQELCNEAQEWKADLPRVFFYESGSGSASGQQGYPEVAIIGSGPRSGMTFRPPTPHGRAPQAARTRSQSKAGPSQALSQAPPRRRPEPEHRKEVVEVSKEEEEEDDDTEDERLRQEEDRRTGLRAQRRGIQEEAEPGQQDSAPKKRKYAVRLEEGFDVERMVDRLLEGTHSLAEEIRTIEEGPAQVEEHEQSMGVMYLLTNTLLQGDFDRKNFLSLVEGEYPVPESQDDEYEKGEIKEAFRAEEYDRIYLELGLLLSYEIRDRDASAKAQKMRHLYVVRDGHLFIKRQVGNPKRIVCERNQQIDIIAALHDGIAGGHRGISATCAKISELYHWDGMLNMVIKENGCNYIFDAQDNLTGFVDDRSIRTKTGPVLASKIEEYYLHYPFVKEFVMNRGSEFTCNEVQTLLAGYGVVANYTTTAHPQANAHVERGHNTIMNLLAKWTKGKPGQWPKFLRAAFFVENVTVKRTTKYALLERHATFPIESFLKTWRRQDLETNLSFEELLDIRARQVDAAEERIREASKDVERSRMEDKMRWDQMTRVWKESLAVGDIVLLYDSSLEKQWSRKLDKRWLGPYRIVRCGEFGAYQIKELDGTEWKDWVSGTGLKKFVARE
ncbi:hypothetical protein CBR_g40282 [Chara braunii]|uniref:Integrase catalytic domain-containing protein n=1 Tax=Chara braunii TaxID=69332 RepID=A0A388K1Z3_CHABU|nr:hypothetical protein CBR_g40282 [Chara braunii]|eukprot:GBG64035.1 hypothetical protein CBR_g40282 [Chara braunii]